MSQALGMIETKGLIAAIEAADVMMKIENISLIGYEKIGGGLVTIIIGGELEAVKDATDAGAEAARCVGEVHSVHVIEKPNNEVEKMVLNIK